MVDTGLSKIIQYDWKRAETKLHLDNISQACAIQRMGRTGRVADGICYRLYTAEDFGKMDEYTQPAILRTPLQEICLTVKMLAGDISIG